MRRGEFKEEIQSQEEVKIERKLRISGEDGMAENQSTYKHIQPSLLVQRFAKEENDERIPSNKRDVLLMDRMHNHVATEHVRCAREQRGNVLYGE